MNLAIKPNRRELIKALVSKHYQAKLDKANDLNVRHHTAHEAGRLANAEIGEAAQAYANKKYKPLLTKLKKLILAEFPDAQVYFTVDLEKGGNSRFKTDGKAHVRLVVHSAEKRELDLPEEVRAAMLEADQRANELYAESQKLYNEYLRANNEAAGFRNREQNKAFQEVIDTVTANLTDEANPHLDALMTLIEKAMVKNGN